MGNWMRDAEAFLDDRSQVWQLFQLLELGTTLALRDRGLQLLK